MPGDWKQMYSEKPVDLPWYCGTAEPELVEIVRKRVVRPCRAIEIGCGQGTEAVFMATQGFRLSAIDLTPRALTFARRLARLVGVGIDFRRASALDLPFDKGTFAFAYDRGCFHHVAPADREAYRDEVHRVLAPRGRLFLRWFSDKVPGQWGPYRIPAREVRSIFSPRFRLGPIRLYPALGAIDGPPMLLFQCLMSRR